MASRLNKNFLIINDTQQITGISDTITNTNSEVPTDNAVVKLMISLGLLPKVGGTIYYIDSSSTNTYTFYDADGNQFTPTTGVDYSNCYYIKSGSSVDKYYVYNQDAMFKAWVRTGTQAYPYMAWTYFDATNQSYIDNTSYISGLPAGKQEWEYYGWRGRVYETLGSYTGTVIGSGKTATSNMMLYRNGVYIQDSQIKWRGESRYSETIWYICDQFNKGTYSLNGSPVPNNTGCIDWYIPSKDELSTMKNAIGAENFARMLYDGSIPSVHIRPWSSSAYSNVNLAWWWNMSFGTDEGMEEADRSYGDNASCLALTRSF